MSATRTLIVGVSIITITLAALVGCDGGGASGEDGNENANTAADNENVNGNENDNTTGGAGGCQPMDCPFEAPDNEFAITCVTPAPCSTDVPVDSSFVIEFNRPINVSELAGDLVSETGDSADLRAEGSPDGMTITVGFMDGLQDDLTYAIVILDSRDTAGNLLSNPGSFCFSTGDTLNCPGGTPECSPLDATDGSVPAFAEFAYSPPFANDSVWNTPIPDAPAIADDSDTMISGFTEVYNQFGGLWLGLRQDAVPVYIADTDTPLVEVTVTSSFATTPSIQAPIPDHAIADCGLDRFLAVLDTSQDRVYEFWRPTHDEDGSWQATVAGFSDRTGSGVFPSTGPGQTDGVRASGFALTAGMIWPHELAAARINHALVFAYPVTQAEVIVPPATTTDGVTTDPNAIPQGSLLQLDPSLDLSTLGLESWEETVAQALQEYGMYLGDTGGGIGLSVLHVYSFEGNPYEGLLPASAVDPANGDALGVLFGKLPPSRFRVLKPL